MDEENEILSSPRRRVKQSISVPFIWEEKPGTPTREWAMTKPTPWIIAPSPARFIVSVPFLWEEKPGKPLDPRPSPHINEVENQLFHESSSNDSSNYHEDWYSLSETDGFGNSSGSVTRNASIDASSPMEFLCPLPPPLNAGLEVLVPLSPPNAGFLNEVCRRERATPVAYQESSSKSSWRQGGGLVVKRTLTLGELIPLSRKLSYRRKTVTVKMKKFSMEFIRECVLPCFSFRTTDQPNNVIVAST